MVASELSRIPANGVRDFFVAALPIMAKSDKFKDLIDGMYAYMPAGSANTTRNKANDIVNAIRDYEFPGTAEE